MGILAVRYCLKPLSLTELSQVLDKVELEELYHKLHLTPSSELLNDSQSIFHMDSMQSPIAIRDAKAKKLGVSVSKYNLISNILDGILNGDEFLSATESEYYIRKQKRKSNYNKSLQEYAILSGTNPLNASRYEKDNVRIRDYDKCRVYESAVVVNIISLQLDEKKYPLKKDEVREFYVEYSFLSRTGRQMETLSLPLLENRIIEYNFKRTFLIDTTNHYGDCKLLAKMVRSKKSIGFTIVEEPVEDASIIGFGSHSDALNEVTLFSVCRIIEMVVRNFGFALLSNPKAKV
ncbi:hypothetical protein Trydic_g16683 [Trypoxylus dichotomus]